MLQKPEKKWAVILDGDYRKCQSKGHSNQFFWSEFEVPRGAVSIPLLVTKKSTVLRKEYLSLIHDIGETRINGKKIREHLKIGKGFSFWWMTMLSQKSPLKVKSINPVLKLRVFEKRYLADGYEGLVLYSDDMLLHEVLRRWCQKLGHVYRWKGERRRNFQLNLRGLYQALPLLLRAFIGLLRRWAKRIRFIKPAMPMEATDDQVTLVTYVPNMDEARAEQGIFYSRYWEELHGLLDLQKWCVNWIWMFIDDGRSSFSRAIRYRDQFQKKAGSTKRFYFLEEFIDLTSVLRAINMYVRLYFKKRHLKAVRGSFHFAGSKMQLWPLMSGEWLNSLHGPAAIEECLMVTAFDTLAEALPQQRWGLYLYENQPWEHALVHAWKKYQRSRIIGYQHSSLRFMLMNYFEDPRTYELLEYPMLLPDMIAINGNGAQKILLEAGFPEDKIFIVEALRYMYLKKSRAVKKHSLTSNKAKVLLVLTGINKNEARQQLLLLDSAARSGALDPFGDVILKPHPYCPIEPFLSTAGVKSGIRIVKTPLPMLLQKVDIVFAANNTSSSIEAALLGIPVIVNLTDDYLNHSVLQGYDDIYHVGSVDDLCTALANCSSPKLSSDYFCLNENLPNWRKLLNAF